MRVKNNPDVIVDEASGQRVQQLPVELRKVPPDETWNRSGKRTRQEEDTRKASSRQRGASRRRH